MAVAALIPVEEYLRTTYRPDCDYVDGEVRERNLGAFDHSSTQLEQGLFCAKFPRGRRRVLTEQRFR